MPQPLVGVEAVLALTNMNIDYLSMTFDQLMEKQRMLTKKYNAAYSSGSSMEVMAQLQTHLEAIRQAIWEMGYKQSFKEADGNDSFNDSIV